MQAYLHTKTKRSDGTFDCFQTIEVPVKVKMMHHHLRGCRGLPRVMAQEFLLYTWYRWEGSGGGFMLSATVTPARFTLERATTKQR